MNYNYTNRYLNIFNGYTEEVKEFIKSKINSDNFQMPSLQTYLGFGNKEISKALISYYDEVYGANVPKKVKIAQAALDSSLLFAINIENGKIGLYTANEHILSDLGDGGKFKPERAKGKNLNGILNCMRVDVDYLGNIGSNDDPAFNTKVVATTKDIISIDTHLFTPVHSAYVLTAMFKRILNQKRVLFKVTQSINGVPKVRYITENTDLLKRYVSDEGYPEVDSMYFPSSAYLYAPVVGAPLVTAAMTRINFFNIKKLELVSEIQGGDIERSGDEFGISAIIPLLTNHYKSLSEVDAFDFVNDLFNFLKSLGYLEDVENRFDTLGDKFYACCNEISWMDRGVYSMLLARYSLDWAGLEKAFRKNVGTFKEYKFDDLKLSELAELVRNNVCKILILSKSAKLSSIICTNNKNILKDFLGEDYFNQYESVGVRLRAANALIEAGDYSKEEAYEKMNLTDEMVENLREYDKDWGSESLLVRGVFASNIDGKSVDYYKLVSTGKVLKIWVGQAV